MNLYLHGLKAVVTGGSAGIGAAIVRLLAEEGCDVCFCARDSNRTTEVLSSLSGLPGKVEAKTLDVTNATAVADWMADIGDFDIFIPNVSALSADWSSAIAVDIQATVNATETAVPYLLRSNHGAITYIGSKAGSIAAPNSAAYGAGKAAMAHYMKSLATRLLPKVRVNTVSPGDTLVEGGLWSKVRDQDSEAFAKVLARNPMNRLATAQEVARVVAFVSSPAASFVAGANWYVDGGSISHVQV
jgi:NAD(P)-dependent dehydrogenase (short-subunit alcohol dehydrogenase family)